MSTHWIISHGCNEDCGSTHIHIYACTGIWLGERSSSSEHRGPLPWVKYQLVLPNLLWILSEFCPRNNKDSKIIKVSENNDVACFR